MNKFEEKDTQVGRTCAEILLAMIKFIIKNENDDEEDDTDDIEDETQIPEHLLYGTETKKEKMELDLNPFYKAFAENISLLIEFLNESEYEVRFSSKIIIEVSSKKFLIHNTTVKLNTLVSQN